MIADRRPGLGGADKGQPVRVRFRAAAGHHLHGFAVVQFGTQRHETTIDLRRDAAVADIRVHSVRKIDGRGTLRQRHDVALGREHVDLVGEQVDLDALQEFFGRPRLLQLRKIREPLAGATLRCCILLVFCLVLPVRCDARLGHTIHLAGADLDFQRQTLGSEQGCMQRLVSVDAGNGDIVLEAAGHRFVKAVYQAQHFVAGADVIHDDPKTVDVDDVREHALLFGHLLVDAVEVFLPTNDLAVDPVSLECLDQFVGNAFDDLALTTLAFLQRPFEYAVAQRVQVAKTEILEFDLEPVNAQPVCDGRIDVERLAGYAFALAGRHGFERLHVVQTIGELHEDDADVLDHRQHHLAETLGLRLRP